MSIKETLNFVKGSVARKDFIPALTHLQIKDGFIYGYNGFMSLGSPIDVAFNACPKATNFIKAINAGTEETEIGLTKGGKLRLQTGRFKTYVECTEEPLPVDKPTGTPVPIGGPLIPVLKKIAPFIAQDASRPWARGVYLKGKMANATNNIAVVQVWLGFSFPIETVIPDATVKELIRIKEEPESVILNESTLTFLYAGGRWLTTALYDAVWPDLSPVLDKPAEPVAFPDGFFEALTELSPFCNEGRQVFFLDGQLATGTDPEATTIEFPEINDGPCFNIDQLLNLRESADKIDFGCYPDPCMFYGGNLRGAVIGMTR